MNNKELQQHISQNIINKNHYNSSKYVGKLNELINDCKPTSLDEWITYYQNYLITTQKNVILKEVIKQILIDNPELTKEDVQACFRKRVYDDVYNGYIREQEAKVYIEYLTHHKLEKTDDYHDRECAVDFFVLDDEEEILFGIQIKPESYFKSTHPGVQKDKIRNEKKYEHLKKTRNIDVVELAYSNNNITYNYEKLESMMSKL